MYKHWQINAPAAACVNRVCKNDSFSIIRHRFLNQFHVSPIARTRSHTDAAVLAKSLARWAGNVKSLNITQPFLEPYLIAPILITAYSNKPFTDAGVNGTADGGKSGAVVRAG